MVIGVKYCGGCNPVIDRPALVEEIGRRLPPGCRITTDRPPYWDLALLVCGCPIACADRPEVRSTARRWIKVAGLTVDLETVPEDRTAEAVIRKIWEWMKKGA